MKITTRLPAQALCVTIAVAANCFASSVFAQTDSAELNALVRSLGEVTQSGSTVFGNAIIIDTCHILTSFHVAFGESVNPSTKRIEIFDNPAVGRRVNFAYGLDAKTGLLTRNTGATVIEFDDYAEDVGRGMVADKAVLRLDECVSREYVNVMIDRPDAEQRVPSGNLVTLSFVRAGGGKYKVLSFTQCVSLPATVVTGLFLAMGCGMPPGTSGSMFLSSERSDKKYRMVGLTTSLKIFPDGSQATFAIYAKALVKFLNGAIGESWGPSVVDQRKP